MYIPAGSFAGGFAQGQQNGLEYQRMKQALDASRENQAYVRQQRALEQAGQRVLIDVIGPPPVPQTVPPGTTSRPMAPAGAIPPAPVAPAPAQPGQPQAVPIASGGPQSAPPPAPYKPLPEGPAPQWQGIPPPPARPQAPSANLTVEEFVQRAKAKGYNGPEIVQALQMWAPIASAEQKQQIAQLTAEVKALEQQRRARKDEDDAAFKRSTLEFRATQLQEMMRQKDLDRQTRAQYQRDLLETRRAIAELGQAGKQAKEQAKADTVEEARKRILDSLTRLRQILESGKMVTGLGGAANRIKEGVGGTLNLTTDTTAHDYLQEVRMLQNAIRNAPKELSGIGPKGRVLKSEQMDRDAIVQGLSAFDNPNNALSSIERLEKYYGKSGETSGGDENIKARVEAAGEKYEPDKFDYSIRDGVLGKSPKAEK